MGRLFWGRECCEWRLRRPAETQTVRPAGNVTCTGPWTPCVRNRSLSMKALLLLRGFTIVETLQTPSSTIARETVEAHRSRHIEICQGCVLSWKVGWYFHYTQTQSCHCLLNVGNGTTEFCGCLCEALNNNGRAQPARLPLLLLMVERAQYVPYICTDQWLLGGVVWCAARWCTISTWWCLLGWN